MKANWGDIVFVVALALLVLVGVLYLAELI